MDLGNLVKGAALLLGAAIVKAFLEDKGFLPSGQPINFSSMSPPRSPVAGFPAAPSASAVRSASAVPSASAAPPAPAPRLAAQPTPPPQQVRIQPYRQTPRNFTPYLQFPPNWTPKPPPGA